MCGRFYIDEDEQVYNFIKNKKLNVEYGEKLPSNNAVVLKYEEGNLMKWGLPYQNKLIINVREESIYDKIMFSDCIKDRRCTIPANWFYEWKNGIKYKILSKRDNIFFMAGIYNKFVEKNGKVIDSFAVVTTCANREMSEIHHRMPVILNSEEMEAYLYPKAEKEEIKALLKSKRDNSLIISPDSGTEQLSLF